MFMVSLVTPMIIAAEGLPSQFPKCEGCIPMTVASQAMFGEYPYCKGCNSNYEDCDGAWNYSNNSWCKVNEK